MSKNNLLNFFGCIVLTLLLTAVFLFNPINKNTDMFHNFQLDSEQLISNFIDAEDIANKNNYIGYWGYTSNFGLQGHAYRIVSKIHYGYMFFHTLTAFALAVIVVSLSFLLSKYDILLSFAMYITMAMSPWVISMAKNLYWVQFTWYLPMLVGLLYYLDVFKGKKIIYSLLMVITVLIKCLCGYEYITTVLVSAMTFPFLKMVKTIKNTKEFKAQFKNLVVMSVSAIVAVAIAFVIHAAALNRGSLIAGFNQIIENSKVRMAWADNQILEEKGYDDYTYNLLLQSVETSTLEVIEKYYGFSTEVIYGFKADYFKPVSVICFVLAFIYCLIKKEPDMIVLYLLFLFSTLSWHIFGKPHSYVHTHINYVLWYMGYVQMLIYIPLRTIVDIVKITINRVIRKEKYHELR